MNYDGRRWSGHEGLAGEVLPEETIFWFAAHKARREQLKEAGIQPTSQHLLETLTQSSLGELAISRSDLSLDSLESDSED